MVVARLTERSSNKTEGFVLSDLWSLRVRVTALVIELRLGSLFKSKARVTAKVWLVVWLRRNSSFALKK